MSGWAFIEEEYKEEQRLKMEIRAKELKLNSLKLDLQKLVVKKKDRRVNEKLAKLKLKENEERESVVTFYSMRVIKLLDESN